MSKNRRPHKKPQSVSYAVASIDITLNTMYAQKVHKRQTERIGGALYQICVLGRKVGAGHIDLTAISDIETQITKRMTDYINDIDVILKEHKAAMQSTASTIKIGYTNPEKFPFKMSTPFQKIYLEALLKLDELCMSFDTMAYNAKMTQDDQVNLSYNWRLNLENHASQIIVTASNFSNQLNALIRKKEGENFEAKHTTSFDKKHKHKKFVKKPMNPEAPTQDGQNSEGAQGKNKNNGKHHDKQHQGVQVATVS
jgi:hypothetical protein